MNETMPTPHPLIQQFERLVGTWNLHDPTGSSETDGQVRFEWLDGGFFLIQHADLNHNGNVIKGLEIIGYAEDKQHCISHSYGSDGALIEYAWEIDGDTLRIWCGERGSAAKFEGVFSADDNVVTGGWEWPGGGYASTMTRVQ